MRELSEQELKPGTTFRGSFMFTEEEISAYYSLLGLEFKPDQPLSTAIFATNKPSYVVLKGRMPQGTIHLKQEAEHYGPVYAGQEYEVEVSMTDKYEKKGRQYLVYETRFFKDGSLVSRQKTTQLLSFAQVNCGGGES